MSDSFATAAERDEYFDSLVAQERILFEHKAEELRRRYAESLSALEHRRRAALIVNTGLDDTEDIEGDGMQDDEEAGVL